MHRGTAAFLASQSYARAGADLVLARTIHLARSSACWPPFPGREAPLAERRVTGRRRRPAKNEPPSDPGKAPPMSECERRAARHPAPAVSSGRQWT